MRTSARSRVTGGAPPRVDRYARNGPFVMTNPLTEINWYAAAWASDPSWTPPSVAYLDADAGLVLPGVAGNYASVPDAAALDITGDITLVAWASCTDWSPNPNYNTLINKRVDVAQRSYMLRTNPTGNIEIVWTADGATFITKASTSPVPFTDGTAGWVAATLDVDN